MPGRWQRALLAVLLALTPVTLGDAAVASAAPQPAATGTITVGTDPSAIAIDPYTRRIFVANRQSNTVSVVDGATQRVIATVSVGAQPTHLAVDPSTHRVYVTDVQSNAISVLDGVELRLTATVPVGYLPGALAVDPTNHRLYVTDQSTDPRCSAGCYDVIRVLDGQTLRQLAITSTLNAWVTAIAVDPTTHDIVFITNGKYPQGEVTVLDPTLHVVAGASLNYWVDDMVIDPLTRQIIIGRLLTDLLLLPWAPSQSRILTQTRVTVGVGPHRLAVDGSTAIVYVTNGSSHTVSVVDVRTTRVVATTPIGPPATVYYTNDNSGPGAIAVDPVTHEVYVADRGGSTVTVLQGLATPSTATPAALPTGGGGGMAGCTPP